MLSGAACVCLAGASRNCQPADASGCAEAGEGRLARGMSHVGRTSTEAEVVLRVTVGVVDLCCAAACFSLPQVTQGNGVTYVGL